MEISETEIQAILTTIRDVVIGRSGRWTPEQTLQFIQDCKAAGVSDELVRMALGRGF